MKVLLVGEDARAHVIAEQLAKNCELYCLMSRVNPGIARLTSKYFICDLGNFEVIGNWAIREKIDLAFIVDERALFSGLADALEEGGITSVSPKMAAAAIGNNRVYAKNIARSIGIAQPMFYVCKNKKDVLKAAEQLHKFVVKPALRMDWQGIRFMDAKIEDKTLISYCNKLIKMHGSVILERKVEGEEFIVQAFSDGTRIAVMPPVRTAKHSQIGDSGKLTEGMGSYSSGKLLAFMRQTDYETAQEILQHIVDALRKRGSEFVGVIHGMFMVTKTGVVLLDVRASFGNPEAINNIMLLNEPLIGVLDSLKNHSLAPLSFKDRATVVKYLVPEGYPNPPKKKNEIAIDEKVFWGNGTKYYFGSVEVKNKKMYTMPSRAIAVYALGETTEEADLKVERSISGIKGQLYWRSDIGTNRFLEKRADHIREIRKL